MHPDAAIGARRRAGRLADLAARRRPGRPVDGDRAPGRRRGARAPPGPARSRARSRRPGDSNTALRVPGSARDHARAARSPSASRRRPGRRATMRTPTGVRTPGRHHVHARARRRGPGAGPAGQARRAIQRLDQLGRRRAASRSGQTRPSSRLQRRAAPSREYQRGAGDLRPLGARPQPDGRLGHRERRGIGGGVGAPDLAEHRRDLARTGYARGPASASCARALVRRSARQRGRHEEQVALVDARQELAAQARDDRAGTSTSASAAVTSVSAGRREREVHERAVERAPARA